MAEVVILENGQSLKTKKKNAFTQMNIIMKMKMEIYVAKNVKLN